MAPTDHSLPRWELRNYGFTAPCGRSGLAGVPRRAVGLADTEGARLSGSSLHASQTAEAANEQRASHHDCAERRPTQEAVPTAAVG
jgi:hypothetical protein